MRKYVCPLHDGFFHRTLTQLLKRVLANDDKVVDRFKCRALTNPDQAYSYATTFQSGLMH